MGGLDTSPFTLPLSTSDANFILRLDEVEEISRDNLDLYNKANSICKSLEEIYEQLSTKIFNLADVYNKMSSNYKKLETYSDFCSENQKKNTSTSINTSQISDCFNFLKITLYAWSNSQKMNSDGILKQITPFCDKNIEKITSMKDMFKLKKALELKHQTFCNKQGIDSTIKMISNTNKVDSQKSVSTSKIDAKILIKYRKKF